MAMLSGRPNRGNLLVFSHLCLGSQGDRRVRALETMIGGAIVALLLDMKWQLLVTDWMTVNRLSDGGAIVVRHVHEIADK
jgi:hypothetical protein